MAGYVADKQQLLNRLRRIEGQVRGIAKMVDEDRYCIEILDQIAAVNQATRAVAPLLEDHLSHCVAEADTPERAEDRLAEASAAIARLVRA